jgi:NAD(P)-dependent dehydrogenase (short-subunit alcohol dehydrogenase family)
MAELDGRCVVVTGAAGGLGTAVTLALAEAGATVVAVDRDAAGLERLRAQDASGRTRPWPADLAQREACIALFPAIVAAQGRVFGLVNLAGLSGYSFAAANADPPPFWEADLDKWQALMDVNLRAAWILAAAAVRHMLPHGAGRIVNVTTSFDTMLAARRVAYGPSKAALEAASAAWAKELDGTGVTVNVLVPGGPADTPMIPQHTLLARERLIQPQVMGPPIVWMMSDAAKDLNNHRVVARLWGTDDAIAPTAWPGYGVQAQRP